jgi:hypothetical protein
MISNKTRSATFGSTNHVSSGLEDRTALAITVLDFHTEKLIITYRDPLRAVMGRAALSSVPRLSIISPPTRRGTTVCLLRCMLASLKFHES